MSLEEPLQDTYRTIDGIAESHLIVKKSRFHGLATHVSSRDAFEQFMRTTQERYAGASHYCYAYILGWGSDREERCSDAGEPTHSAGPPILTAVRATGLTNIACIVVRYFGGIKLGIGGLIRAYGRCARECLAAASVRTEVFTERLVAHVPYDALGAVIQWIERAGGRIEDVRYSDHAEVLLELRKSRIPDFRGEMQGRAPTIRILPLDEK